MRKVLAVALVAVLALGACKKDTAAVENGFDDGPSQGGRYHGIGIYSINELWEQLVLKEPAKNAPPINPQAAVLADDTEIIVSVDSRTGEVRQCGNFSGHCISSNPWKAEASAAPAALTKHAADLAREREEDAREQEKTWRSPQAKTAAAARRAGITKVDNSSEPQD